MNLPRVLIVDDEAQILEEYSGLFDDSPLEIQTTTDPREAVTFLTDDAVTVLVSDQRMPEMTGLELVQKAKEISPETVRLILTAHADQDAMIEAINVGEVFRFLLKPIQPQDFIDAVTDAVDYAQEMSRIQNLLKARSNYSDATSDLEIIQTQLDERTAEVQMLLAESERYAAKQKDSFKAVLAVLVSMLQIKNQELFRNGQWVASFSVKIGKLLGLPERTLNTLQLSGYLRSLGLLLLPDLYMEKSLSMFNQAELQRYHRFPLIGEQILKKLPGFTGVGAVIGMQLERYNGSGPKGLSGDDIPLPAQIIAIAQDTFQVLFMRSQENETESIYGRTYMINHIRKHITKLYSPRLAKAAIKLLSEAPGQKPR